MTLMGNSTRFMLLAVLLGGCASAPATPINNVARADLACDQVSVNQVADNRWQASGCSKTGTYAKLCSGRHCSWVRVRSATEIQQQSSGGYAATGSYGQRQIIPAPPPPQREIIPAPPPAQAAPREIIPAPPPADPQATVPQSSAPQAAPTQPPQQPVPLSQGDLSQPYSTEVPLEPTTQRVQYPPPAPLVEDRPPPPMPNYQWVGGYWWWGNPAWTWVPGYWCAPRFGYSYVASSWYWNSGYWWFGPGGWARPGSTIIVANVGPRPSRYVTSRSFTPHYISNNGPARIGTGPSYAGAGPARAPSHYAPQSSPMYQYPTSSSQRAGRMGVNGPARAGGYSGLATNPGMNRFGAGSTNSSVRNYNYQTGRINGGGMSRMGSSPSAPATSSGFRSSPMMRMPSSAPSNFGGGFYRGGSGGMGGGGFNRGGGGGGGRIGGGGGAPHGGARR